MSALRKQLNVGTCCGKCHACAKTVLRECLEDQSIQTALTSNVLAAA